MKSSSEVSNNKIATKLGSKGTSGNQHHRPFSYSAILIHGNILLNLPILSHRYPVGTPVSARWDGPVSYSTIFSSLFEEVGPSSNETWLQKVTARNKDQHLEEIRFSIPRDWQNPDTVAAATQRSRCAETAIFGTRKIGRAHV